MGVLSWGCRQGVVQQRSRRKPFCEISRQGIGLRLALQFDVLLDIRHLLPAVRGPIRPGQRPGRPPHSSQLARLWEDLAFQQVQAEAKVERA